MSRDKLQKMPLFQKSMEILEIVDRIADLVPPENKFLMDVAEFMRADATQIPAKIAGAFGDGPYDLKMENATIIRKNAMQIYVQCNSFFMDEDFRETEYLKMLRNEIEEFRVLFAEWVKTFDPWDYYVDRWGLFNPPGVNYDDKDPDRDIPFNDFPEGDDEDDD